jgi:signal transduction histidine kinase
VTRRKTVVILLATAALLAFAIVVRNLSLGSLAIAANKDVRAVLQQSLADQKELARAHPEQAAHYRARFDALQQLSSHLEVVSLTRATLTRRLELALTLLVAAMLVIGGAVHLAEVRARARDKEAARRHAHEIRTPLTAAQLELGRLTAFVTSRLPNDADEIRQAEVSILEELEQLRKFTTSFVSLAAIGQPRLRVHDLAALVHDFAANFEPMWPSLRLDVANADGDCRAEVDRDMVRQVLVNLCTNSALALDGGSGSLRLIPRCRNGVVTIDVSDDGPGLREDVRARLFEPYTTTRAIGEGMGLGLSISKKIMLDHGGDLEWVDTDRGATFRLTFPAAESAS